MSQVAQLPLWPEVHRGLPNGFARSALFNVDSPRKGEARGYYKQHQVAAVAGVRITYTGEELRQDDEDVLLQALHLGRTQALGLEVRFTARTMLKALRWTLNGESIERLQRTLTRLSATALEVRIDRPRPHGGSISLVRRFEWHEPDGTPSREWRVVFEPEIVELFAPGAWTRLDWELRLALPPLAKWLHSFFLTHAEPLPYKVATLHKLTGSKARVAMFRVNLRRALALLVEHGFLLRASVEDGTDLVQVWRA